MLPTTSTLASGNNVAVCPTRGWARLPVSSNSKERAAHGCTRASAAAATSDGMAMRIATFGKAGRSPAIRQCNVFIGLLLDVFCGLSSAKVKELAPETARRGGADHEPAGRAANAPHGSHPARKGTRRAGKWNLSGQDQAGERGSSQVH